MPDSANRPHRPIDPCECDDDPDAQPSPTTTHEELEAYYIVRAILRTTVDCRRVMMRDCATDCSVLLDGDPAKRICTFHLHQSHRSVSIFGHGLPARIALASINDLHDHAARLRATVAELERDFPTRKRVLDREVMA